MTQAEYLAEKKKKYQEYKAGKITNYAYIQWKKKNDPSLNPGGAASTSTGKAMTDKEYAEISNMLAEKFSKLEISPSKYTYLIHKLNEFKWGKGEKKSADEVKAALGLTPATSVSPTDPGKTAEQQAEEKLQKKLLKVYKEAQKDLKAKLKQFSDKFAAKDTKMLEKLANGKITKAQYDQWKQGQVFQTEQWKKKVDQVTGVLANANSQALQIINKEKMGVFAENANFQSYQLTQDTGMDLSFAIYDVDTVARLVRDDPELLPRKELNGKKDKAWNKTKIANAVAQSVIQGESIPDLATRIARDTASENGTAMMRYARTAMVGAQNAGRMETLERAKAMGIKVKKKWLATLDGRTRDSHAALDGQTVDVDAYFISPLGKIKYPGDPNAENQGDIWNCRCTLVYEYEDYPNDPEFDQRRDNESGAIIQNMPYKEWKAANEGSALNDLNIAKTELAQSQKALIKNKVKEDKVYDDLWKDPVTLADYPAKKDSIKAKRDYYTAEIDKLHNAIANGASWAKPEKVKELEKKRKLLNEFEIHGKLLEKRNEALKKVQDVYDKVGLQQQATAPGVAKAAKKAAKKAATGASAAGGTTGPAAGTAGTAAKTSAQNGQFSPDAWDEKTKRAAPFYNTKREADAYLRPLLDAKWDTLTDEQKYAVWEYTHNSNPMNKRLSGYGDTSNWSRSDFVGFDKAVWGLEDNWRSLGSKFSKFGKNGHPTYHKAITDLTKAIEKTPLQQNMWFKREGGPGDFAGMMEGGGFNFDTIKKLFDGHHSQKELEKILVGQKGKNNAFTSTGIAKDARWGGNIYYKIYAPKGTKCIYAEPQSYYGDTISGEELYRKGKSYSGVGSEAEVIMQRGTEYRIKSIQQKGTGSSAQWEIEMEIVGQPDYFKYGDEDTYNDGKTRHQK